MYINEMANGSAVTIEVKNKDGKEIELETQVVDSYDGGEYKTVLVEALRHEGQLLTFSSVNCVATIVNATDNKVYIFKLIGILKRETNGQVYHCLVSTEDVAEENRRSAKRFGMGEKASIQVLGSTSILRGYVHDISATGIAVRVGDSSLSVGDVISVSFEHQISGAQLKVIAKIIRKQEQEKETLFGCVIQKHDAKYTQLISYLMRQECKVRK